MKELRSEESNTRISEMVAMGITIDNEKDDAKVIPQQFGLALYIILCSSKSL